MIPTLRTTLRLDPAEVAAVHRLVREVAEHDRHLPLSEHVMLHLPLGGDEDVRHVLADHPAADPAGEDPAGEDPAKDAAALAGYAHLDVTDKVAGSSAEVCVRPAARRRGIGRQLVEELLRQSPDGRLRLWAHGEHPGAAHLAYALGFERSRVLWQMRRPLADELPAYSLPEGVRLRTFVVGQDEQEWTALNAKAFADHPDQGRWGVEEVLLREKEPWFDAAGFLVAEQDGRMVGFHWTKVHGSDPGSGEHAHEPVGEVYVVGVDPAEQGRGLGPALTLAGLHSLRHRGLDSVLLYVDESNVRATRVYERLGFSRAATDVCWSR
ncbi:MAG TPA: mycothiol synthase [Mycobacteriales bacterium]|nr:mycothiol synthase [Mycobacteriales bacterium]